MAIDPPSGPNNLLPRPNSLLPRSDSLLASVPAQAASDPGSCAARLRRSVVSLARRLRSDLRHDGLSNAKLAAVSHLFRAGPLSPTDLAAREGVKPQSLTRLLADLESEGWIRRRADEADGRRWLIELTASGRKGLMASARSADRSLAELLRHGFSDEERHILAQACALLERMDDVLASNGSRGRT